MCILSKICLNSVPSKLVLAKIEISTIRILNNETTDAVTWYSY